MTDVLTSSPSPTAFPSDTTPTPRVGKAALWTGRVLSGLTAAGLMLGGFFDVIQADFVVKDMTAAGYPESSIVPLGIAVLASGVLYLIPRTAVLGAILLTAYLGGAVNHHVRMNEPAMIVPPILFAVLLWLGLVLRDAKLRQVLPIR